MITKSLQEVIQRKTELIKIMTDPEQIKIMQKETNELKLLVQRRKEN